MYNTVQFSHSDQQQVAQLWQRDRASSINDFRWRGQFEAIMMMMMMMNLFRPKAAHEHEQRKTYTTKPKIT